MASPRILICGIGNRLKKDDGIGPRVIEELEKRAVPANVTLSDFGTSGLRTALEIGSYDRVIFIDAIERGNHPGRVYRIPLSKEDLQENSSPTSFTFSLHESDLGRILATAALIDGFPKEVVVLGCEPEDLSFGLGLSSETEKAVCKIVDLALDEIGRENSATSPAPL